MSTTEANDAAREVVAAVANTFAHLRAPSTLDPREEDIMVDRELVVSKLDASLVNITEMLAQAIEAYDLPRVRRLSERRDTLLDTRLALHGK